MFCPLPGLWLEPALQQSPGVRQGPVLQEPAGCGDREAVMTNKAQDIKEFVLCSLGFQVIFFCLLPFPPG